MDYTLCQEAEEQLLGRILLYPDQMSLCYDLTSDDFPSYAKAFEIIRNQYQNTGSLVIAHLSKVFSQSGLPVELPASLAGGYVGGSTVENLRSVLKGYSTRRRVVQVSLEASQMANDLTIHPSEAVSHLSKAQADLADDAQIISQAEILNRMLKDGVNGKYYSTGLHGLDRLMGGGLYEGKVYGFSGRAKSGKTLLASTISYNLKDCKHLYVAMEMGAAQIAQRKFARQGGFNSLKFLDGSKTVDGVKPDTNTYYLDAAGISWDALLTQLVSAVVKLGIKGVFIDYWQLVQGQKPRETEEKHLRDVAQGLADFAKNHGVWVFLLSQTNEEGKTFAGQGLIKACDQLWFIETPKHEQDKRWLRMGASRYTPHADYGSEELPPLTLDKLCGPHFKEE